MTRIVSTFILCSFFYSCAESQTKEAYNSLESVGTIGDQQTKVIYDRAKLFPNRTELAVAFIKDSNAEFYGVKRTNDSLATVENHSVVFEIGSISKVFTSTLLASTVVQEELKLDDNINDHLEFPIKNEVQLQFLTLANHTSGLPRLPSNLNLFLVDQSNPYKDYKEPQLIKYLTEQLQLAEPKYDYSNLGAGLLGYMLTKIHAQSYESLLQEFIAVKYNMNSTTTNRDLIASKLVAGRNEAGREVSNWDFAVLKGAGGIFSNVEDLSKFAKAQFDPAHNELALTQQKTITVNEKMSLGLGWHIVKSKSGNLHWHNGGTGGYTSSMAIDLINKTGVIILSNVSAFSSKMGNIDKLCFELIETLN